MEKAKIHNEFTPLPQERALRFEIYIMRARCIHKIWLLNSNFQFKPLVFKVTWINVTDFMKKFASTMRSVAEPTDIHLSKRCPGARFHLCSIMHIYIYTFIHFAIARQKQRHRLLFWVSSNNTQRIFHALAIIKVIPASGANSIAFGLNSQSRAPHSYKSLVKHSQIHVRDCEHDQMRTLKAKGPRIPSKNIHKFWNMLQILSFFHILQPFQLVPSGSARAPPPSALQ